jgi:DNA primase
MAATPELSPFEIERYYRDRVPDLRPQGGQWRARCPLHGSDHRDDSLSINMETGRWCCHSDCGGGRDGGGNLFEFEKRLCGCDFKQALENVGAIIGRGLRAGSHKQLVAEYEYTDATGKLLYVIRRWHPKSFSAHRPDPLACGNGTWLKPGIQGIPRVLYNLPAVLAAKLVFVCEGEKDADALIQRDLVATTCAFGAEKWRAEYAQYLIGKDVVIVPDRDERGTRHRDQIARSLKGKARSIRVIELPAELNQGEPNA